MFYVVSRLLCQFKINPRVDDGEIIAKRKVTHVGKETLLRVLILKKIVGGKMIADYVNGNLKQDKIRKYTSTPFTYPFPSLRDILFLRARELITQMKFLIGKS